MPGLDRPAYGGPMSDFEAVLERLLTDPSFAVQLARDPDRALAGYRLDSGEDEVLRSQVIPDSAADVAKVEMRMTKSSTFGVFSSLGEWAEFGTSAGVAAPHGTGALGDPGATQGLGSAPDAWGIGGGTAEARTGLGDAPESDLDGLPAVSQLGDAPRSGLGEAGAHGVAQEQEIAPPKGYHNRVDADGDGRLDKSTYRGREDGGVDILVDLNRDGRTDFIGHDLDLDNRVDSAEYDKDHDGVFEKRMYDDNGDGWLDRTVWHHD
jgi:hypothetical protein